MIVRETESRDGWADTNVIKNVSTLHLTFGNLAGNLITSHALPLSLPRPRYRSFSRSRPPRLQFSRSDFSQSISDLSGFRGATTL